MKTLLLTLVLLAIGIWVGVLVHHDSGYVLISYQHWSIETSLWVAVLALLVGLCILYGLLRFFSWLFNLSGRFQSWSGRHKIHKSQQLTQGGLCLLAEGNWKKAEDMLIKASQNQSAPLINYLASARAAQEQQNFQKRDEYLKKAFDTSKHEEMAIGITQAQLQISARQWEQALATLRHLSTIKPNHRYVLKCLQAVYNKVEDWKSLQQMLPSLKKHKVLSPQKQQAVEKRVALALLNQFDSKNESADSLNALWRKLDKSLHSDTDCIVRYSCLLCQLGNGHEAYKLILHAMKRNWHSELLTCLPNLPEINLEQVLKQCEQWHNQHPNNAALLFCLGTICHKLQLWGKARDYLLDCIALKPLLQAYLLLGEVYQSLGNEDQALQSYHEGLMLVKNDK